MNGQIRLTCLLPAAAMDFETIFENTFLSTYDSFWILFRNHLEDVWNRLQFVRLSPPFRSEIAWCRNNSVDQSKPMLWRSVPMVSLVSHKKCFCETELRSHLICRITRLLSGFGVGYLNMNITDSSTFDGNGSVLAHAYWQVMDESTSTKTRNGLIQEALVGGGCGLTRISSPWSMLLLMRSGTR